MPALRRTPNDLKVPVEAADHPLALSSARNIPPVFARRLIHPQPGSWLMKAIPFLSLLAGGLIFQGTFSDTPVSAASPFESWHPRSSPTRFFFMGLAWGNGHFVASFFTNQVAVSTDGKTWSLEPLPDNQVLGRVWFVHDRFVGGSFKAGQLLVSQNGSKWEGVPFDGAADVQLSAFGYRPNHWLAIGGSKAFLSTDGYHWKKSGSLPSGNVYGVALGSNRWLLPMDNCKIATSTNGEGWETQSFGFKRSVFGVAVRDGTIVAVGGEGRIWTSHDASNWMLCKDSSEKPLLGVEAGPPGFVAVGMAGTILTSSDGFNWVRRSSGTTATLRRAAYGAGSFVIVGDGGTILQSDQQIDK